MHYDWRWHSYANDFGNTHPFLKQPSTLLAVCQKIIQPMVMCFCVPESWLMRRSLAPTYFNNGTRRAVCVWVLDITGWKWSPLKHTWLNPLYGHSVPRSHQEMWFIFWDLNIYRDLNLCNMKKSARSLSLAMHTLVGVCHHVERRWTLLKSKDWLIPAKKKELVSDGMEGSFQFPKCISPSFGTVCMSINLHLI